MTGEAMIHKPPEADPVSILEPSPFYFRGSGDLSVVPVLCCDSVF